MRSLFKAPREDGSWFRVELDCSENNQQFSPKQEMKTKRIITKTLWNSLLIIFLGTLLATQARGQIFVTQNSGTVGEYDAATGATINSSLVSYYSFGAAGIAVSEGNLWVCNFFAGTVGKYNATTGATINASLVSGLSGPFGVAVSGGSLWVTSYYDGTIGEYDANTGAAINASLVFGLDGPQMITVSGGNLFVVNSSSGTIGEYNATTGATINASLVSGLNSPAGVAVSGGNLWVTDQGTVGEYNATTGAPINASLVSGLVFAGGIAQSGGNLFVAINSSGTIGKYNATTGATINASLVSGLNGPYGIAVVEPNAPPTITITDADGNLVPCGSVKTVSNNGQCAAVTVPLTITANGNCPGTITVASTRSDGQLVTAQYPVGSTTVTSTATDACGNTSTCVFRVTVTNNRTITSNFNGTLIPGNSYLWFNAVLKPSGLNGTNGPVTVRFTNQTITSGNFNLNPPDTTVVFDPNATCASAVVTNTGQWTITAPKSGLSGNTFLSGLSYQVPAAGLPGGINPVSWSGTFTTDTQGLGINWQWAAAVYTTFNANNGVLGVKATDDNHRDCTYLNSDHAGTPEQYKSSVAGGARGGGGSNYTGGLSGTQTISPCDTF